MNAALLDLIACPACGGRLAVADRDGLVLACRRCPARYPVLGGVPIVVPAPATYLAAYRDAVLATLADAGRATRRAVEVVRAFAEAAGPAEPLAFGDDWVAREDARPAPATDDAAIARWLTDVPDPTAGIAALVPASARVVVEVGCGAAGLTRALVARDRLVVAADLSLRAVLRSLGRGVDGVVADAEALPFRPRSIDALCAVNLIDLLGLPDEFLVGASAALRATGRAILTTPDPSLASGDDDTFARALAAAGFTVDEYRRGTPWLRAHSPRHYQLYFTDLAVARVSAGDRGRRDRGRDRGRDRSRGRAGARPRAS